MINDLRAPSDDEHQHYVLMELSAPLPTGSLRHCMETLFREGIECGTVLDGVLAESKSQRQQLWRLRELIPEAEKLAGRSIKHDISVAIGDIPELLKRLPKKLEALCAHRASVYGHIGDGNLHYNILAPSDVDPDQFRATYAGAISEQVHQLAAQMRGSFSAEHGIGKLKRDDLARSKDPVTLEVMKTLKRSLDPKGIMNPGKVL